MSDTMLSANELQLGDTVVIDALSGFGGAVVIEKLPTYVKLFRPYAHLADFSMSKSRDGEQGSQVMAYVGAETWQEWTGDMHKRFRLITRRTLK